MKLLLIDNYDSYTYNLYQLIARVSGVEPEVVHNDAYQRMPDRWNEFDAFVISPGPGHPARARDLGIGKAVVESGRPLLGVCLGHQGIALCHGARVVQAPEPMHGRIARVRHDGTGLFAGLPQGLAAVRYHSSIVAAPLPACLRASAWSEDGTIMALQHQELLQFGVQFHPESVATEHGERMIENFLARVGRSVASSISAPGVPRARRRRSAGRASGPGRARPVRYLELACAGQPEDVFVALYGRARHSFWLDSAVARDRFSRFSFMGAPTCPGDRIVSYRATERSLIVERDGARQEVRDDILSWLERELEENRREPADVPFPLQGGAVGYLGYEVGQACVAPWRDARSGRAPATPDAAWLLCQRYLAFDHETGTWYAVTSEPESARAQRWLHEMRARLAGIAPAPAPGRDGVRAGPLTFHLARSSERYLRDIAACMDDIRAGESYEVCLTNRIVGPAMARPLDVYRVLRARNPAPFAAYLRFATTAILSCSPELFLRVGADGGVTSKPIKGTRARSHDAAEDRAVRHALAASVKDRSENLMIVDLLRNDLGRVCQVGSVEVPRMMHVESFATVHQLVSTVTGVLCADRSVIDCVRAAFPGGSMTGAPKLRTMEIIDALEGAPRGVYSGCLGHLSHHGAADLAMTIRTAVATSAATEIGVGGAIVALSDARAELEEMLLKGRALMAGMAAAMSSDGSYSLRGASLGRAREDPGELGEPQRLGHEIVGPGAQE